MKSIKKVFIAVICVTLALNMFLIGGPVKSDYDSHYLLPDGDYKSILSYWKNSFAVSAEALSDNNSDATPGEKNTVYGSAASQNPATKLANRATLQYYYEGTNYAYGIDSEGQEVISFKRANGQLFDAIDGAGVTTCRKAGDGDLISSGGIKSFVESTDADGNTVLTVDYNITGNTKENPNWETDFPRSKITVKYTFTTTGITLYYTVDAYATEKTFNNRSRINREYLNGCISSRAQVNSKWVYPDDLDYPYPDFEGLIYIDELTDDLRMYTSLRDSNITKNHSSVEKLNGNSISLNVPSSGILEHLEKTLEYTISFADMTAEKQNPDYLGLFRGKKYDFAAGVAPVTPESDHSTVFVGNSVDLNLNVTNLLDEDLTFSLRYDVRDYYGNVVDSGLYVDNTICKGLDANKTVSVSGDYGMYYLNLYVITENNTYSECYPFALIPEYTYNPSTTGAYNPFGFASTTAGGAGTGNIFSDFTLSKYEDTANLLLKIGVGTERIGAGTAGAKLAEILYNAGVTKLNATVGGDNNIAGSSDYITTIIANLKTVENYVDAYEVGNELSLYALQDESKSTYMSRNELYPIFYYYMWLPVQEAIANGDIKSTMIHIPTQASAAEIEWPELMAASYTVQDVEGDTYIPEAPAGTVIPSIWSDIKVLTAHIYASNRMPDLYGSGSSAKYGGPMWNIEAGAQRIYSFLADKVGDPDTMDSYFTEVGYPTQPEVENSVCLRTQADYFVRIGAICASYGIDRIQYYQFYDRTSHDSGFNHTDANHNYGAFYMQDFYGVIKPKPAGVAFAIMTSQLETMKKNGAKIFDKYDGGYTADSYTAGGKAAGGVRAFVFDTVAHGNVVVAYTNQEVLSNGSSNNAGSRTPTLPWNNQWTETYDTTFDTTQDTVKVVDVMGNETIYTASNGKVTIPLTGSPVYIYGVS